ncbi:glycoside hydrolase family 3 C-terminal domain-containing protein [Granulicella sp. dw_53]|uniref:glycoside hydrolase family 3 C-terminal domain-containing protein n=1 Tax=Granulicella sp. dw_53 TaxID=2719792 RepID=UPI0021066852|nr:glycoside hydrolase family 3 C-terminal domain-containing protein [Granulicella sp. dw_53]
MKYQDARIPLEQRVNDLLLRMTIQEKVRQLDMYSSAREIVSAHTDDTHAALGAAFVPEKAQSIWGNLGVGAVHDLNPTPEQANAIQKWVVSHNRLGIPALFIEEGLHGYDTGTVFPAPIGLAGTWDPEIARETGASIAAEARSHGVGMILGPVLDLARDPRWGRVEEDFGEDTYLTGQFGLAYVQGMQGETLASDHSTVAEPKHFVGHGSPEGGENTSPVHMGEREMRTEMLAAFEPAFRQGHAMATMVAYHEIDGIPMTADPLVLKQILRGEWGFRGFALSDLGAIRRLYEDHRVASSPQSASCLAIRSGVDMQFYDFDHAVFQKALIDCIHDGTLASVDLDRAVRSVLRVKFMLGLFDHPYVDPTLMSRAERTPTHLALSLRSARESMTLLKNDGNLLPLAKTTKQIAVIGPNGNIARYGDYERESNGKHVSLLDGIREEAPNALVTFDEGKDISVAVAMAKQADVVILGMGEWQGVEGEGFDRMNLDLPGNQEPLLEAIVATGKPVVLVLENGRPLTIQWAKQHVSAILEAWYPGELGGQAVAETLFGDNNPAGRLTITFPKSTGQLPVYYSSDPSRVHKYVDDDGKPLFSFGWGLSYTTFRYDRLTVTQPTLKEGQNIHVTVDVINTGSQDGDDVVQLYLRRDYSSVETPERELKGFTRIHLKAGETRTVSFNLPQRELQIWNTDRKWIVEPGRYTLWAGGSSEATLQTTFQLR